MSVHTLREDNGTVSIGANITKAEALDAGPQILQFCYEINGQEPPIVLERLNWPGTDRTLHTLNGVTIRRDGQMIAVLGQVITVTTARLLARALAEMAEDAENEPDPAEVERLAAFFSEEATDTSFEGLARQMLRRFKVEERAS